VGSLSVAGRRAPDRLAGDGGLLLRLPFAGPLDWATLIAFFAARAIPGVELIHGDTYRRTVVIDGDPGVLELSGGGADHLLLRAHLPASAGLIPVAERARRIASLDVDVAEPTRHLAGDPAIGPLLSAHPGVRVPGTWDPFETGVRAVIGQQVTVAGATTIAGRLVERIGDPVPGLRRLGLTHTFPSPQTLASADLSGLGMPEARAEAIRSFARAVADGDVRLDRSMGLDRLVTAITAIPGLGPWTAHYIALRLGERDAFPAADLGLQRALGRHIAPSTAALTRFSERWRPWRAWAAAHFWMAASSGSAR
jgi:AraC family transcriptional regulator of adaptative response / DNA-3-methyladenine glycosylase II